MKPCYENNGPAIYVGRAANVHNPLFTLQLNILTGAFLLVSCSIIHISKSIVVCTRSRPKR